MTLLLSGTNGVSDVDGTAATPALRGSDTNTGIFFPAADTIAFAEGGVESARFDSAGNLGIGTTSPTQRVDVVGAGAAIAMRVATTSGNAAFVETSASTGSVVARLQSNVDGAWSGTLTNHPYFFQVNGAERARIDSSGNLLVGTTINFYGSLTGNIVARRTGSGGAGVFYTDYSGDVSTQALAVGKFDNNSTTSQVFVRFGINAGGLGGGQINANGSGAAAFGSFSDARLKENIVNLDPQLDKIMALRPVEFDYIESEGGGHQTGFIAQEMQEVYSDAVGEREDGMLTVTGWDKTMARLVKAIQEQQAIINAQETALNQLKAQLTSVSEDVAALTAEVTASKGAA